jgi:hypothetical protein
MSPFNMSTSMKPIVKKGRMKNHPSVTIAYVRILTSLIVSDHMPPFFLDETLQFSARINQFTFTMICVKECGGNE